MMTLWCLGVFLSSVVIDYAYTRCTIAIGDGEAHRAARWSVIQWTAATIGFVAAIKVSLWVLPFEAAGLYLGVVLAVKPRK